VIRGVRRGRPGGGAGETALQAATVEKPVRSWLTGHLQSRERTFSEARLPPAAGSAAGGSFREDSCELGEAEPAWRNRRDHPDLERHRRERGGSLRSAQRAERSPAAHSGDGVGADAVAAASLPLSWAFWPGAFILEQYDLWNGSGVKGKWWGVLNRSQRRARSAQSIIGV